MKNLIYIIASFLGALSLGCNSGNNNLSISTTDSNTDFRFEAKYPEQKTKKLETYLDGILNNDLPLDQDINLFVNLSNGEKFNLKAKEGWLVIQFDKKNSSLTGYLKVKHLVEGIKNKLTEK